MSELAAQQSSFTDRLKQFVTVIDERFEDYRVENKVPLVIRDFMAGLIVALIAIPLGVGFSIASGMRPEQGIIAGAVAGIIGGFFGGSKYQVYGPTAAFITVIAGIVHQHDPAFLILASLIAGSIILLMGVFGLGKYFHLVPHSIIVGFTMGIAATIMISQMPDVLGAIHVKLSHHTVDKLKAIPALFSDANGHTLFLAALTFFIIRQCYKFSVFIPGPLIAIVLGAFITNNIWHEHAIPLVSTKYGHIEKDLFNLTLPSLGQFAATDLIMPVIAIIFIASLESLLSSKMADRLANNKTPSNPDKELFGQGLVNMITPLLNGFPCTGALARTATSIKVGAVSPLASMLKGSCVIGLMLFFATYLSILPMACIGGLLIFVASNMVKPFEVQEIWKEGLVPTMIMLLTAVLTVFTDLLVAVGVATTLHYLILPLTPKKTALNLDNA